MAALARATEAAMRATDEKGLVAGVCRIVVEVGGYRTAFVGYAHDDRRCTVEPVACHGEIGHLAGARMSWADDEYGRGPIGRSIRLGQTQVTRDSLRSCIALPLRGGDKVLGALCIGAGEADAFDDEEVGLLENLAANLAYGIGTLKLQVACAESESHYRSLVEHSPDGILIAEGERIVFANAAAERIFQASERHPLVDSRLADLIGSGPGGEIGGERRLRRLDGDEFDAEVVPVTISQRQAQQLVVRDVTDRKQVQAQLIQTAKLATLGEMAAGMAHELSQPIHVIRLAAEGALLLCERGRASEPYKRQQFSLIADQTRRMAEIIDHIRIFSRKDSGPVGVFEANESVRLALELMERQVQAENVALSVTPPSIACPVVGRPVQLEQVVINLIANALDSIRDRRHRDGEACPPGRIEVVTAANEDLGSVWIAISDNGAGIPQPILERIFEPFFTTKEVGQGTGLGLSVSFGIIAAMNGRLDACNNKDGASFVITLRRTATAPEGTRLESPGPAGGVERTGHHLLVVDDEEQAVEAMAFYLEETGYRVSKAFDGEEAFAVFMADPADLVITDLRMPRGNGIELVAKIRDFDPLLPIIVVTGHLGLTESAAFDLDDDRSIVLKKPVGLDQLGDAIKTLLEREL